jgi:ectoine hydroxylase-related dioxygenase (phytanoyl-CoA dioxygenase family)/mannose-6-phosphate isomerase-like protein (cupin superfamily)
MLHDRHTDHKTAFARNGFIGPIPLLTPQQSSFLARHLVGLPTDHSRWMKSLAASDPISFEVASNPELLRIVRDLIGDDVVLWGCSLVLRKPGEVHVWHCDAEACAAEGGFVSVWIGLWNTKKESALLMIPGSHTYGASIQEVAAREKIARNDRNDDVALRLANAQRPGAEIVQPEVRDGEAIFFDGRMWHGSRNGLSDTPRAALLLQYARADLPCRVPEIFEWPFRPNETKRPPAIVVSGQGDREKNELVAAPAIRAPNALGTNVHHIYPHSRCPDDVTFMPVHCFQGHTDNLDYLECHYSVLMPGACPHLPHRHLDEEILVVMSGAAELVLANSPRDPNPRIMPAPAGSAAYYSPFQHHTIRNASSEPVRYAMMRWKSPAISAKKHLPARFVPPSWLQAEPRQPLVMKTIFEGPSAFLGKLQAHITLIAPGNGYAAHRDDHDVAIFLIEGEIAVLGQRIIPPAVVFFPAGHLHDMRVVGQKPAKYICWEFHRTEPGQIPVLAQEPAEILAQ